MTPTSHPSLTSVCQQVEIHRPREEFRAIFSELYNKPGVNCYIECWAEVNQRHPHISPSCGKGWCAVHKQLHHPWGCALWRSASSSPEVCHLNRVKKYDTVAMTTLGILHKWFSLCVRAYECLCMSVCLGVMGESWKNKETNYLPN